MARAALGLLLLLLGSEGVEWRDGLRPAFEHAEKTGKPLFVVFRCEP
jgi:hypothetical protein